MGPHLATADSSAVPQVVFTAPEAAGVGRTAEQAEAEGYRIKVVDVDLGATVAGAALYEDDYRGRARMIVDEDRECLLGVGVTELLHSATVALAGEVRIDRLWHAIPSFASSSEAWLRLLEAYRGRPAVNQRGRGACESAAGADRIALTRHDESEANLDKTIYERLPATPYRSPHTVTSRRLRPV